MSSITTITAPAFPQVSAETLELIAEAGRSLEDVIVVVDGVATLDEDALAEIVAGLEGAPAAAPVLDLELELDEDLAGQVDDGRELEDFDFAALVAGLDLADVEASHAAIEVERPAFVAAARRAGKKNPVAEFYNSVNTPLFHARRRMQAEMAEMEQVAPEDQDMRHRVVYGRLRREVEYLTELVVRFNYGMTKQYVRQFTSHTSREDSSDFQSAAVLGLMNSIETFDPDKGRFGSWAYKRIQREVLRAVRDADFPNMNHGDFEKRPDVLRAYARLAGPEDARRVPSLEEVAAEAGVTVELVTRVIHAPKLNSLHQPSNSQDDGSTEIGDLIPDTGASPESQVMSELDVNALMEFGMSALETREHYVLCRRYGLDGEPAQCLSSIGTQLRLSREAVRQIEAKAIAKLLHPMTLRKLVRHGRR